MSSLHLLGSRLNLAHIWEAARQELIRVLGQPDQKKLIVWDEGMIGPIGMAADVHFMKQQGVCKMVRLPVTNLTEAYSEPQEYYFFAQPTIKVVDLIIDSIRTSTKKQGKKFVVVFVPQKAGHCVTRLNEFGLIDGSRVPFGFYIEELHLEMLAFDHDVISLDIHSAFNDLFVDQDPNPLYHTAKAICKLQALYGVIPRIYGKGKNAKVLADLMERMRKEMFSNLTTAKEIAPQIDTIILLDRTVDLLTPLSTQLTYEGLIDEIYSIKYCIGRFPRQMFSEEVQQVAKGAPAPSGPLPIMFNSDEDMFQELRDLNFSTVGQFLTKEAKKITASFEERHDAKTVSQLKQFVQKLPHIQQAKLSLSRHTTVAELIKTVTDRQYFLEQIYCEQQIREEDNSDRPVPYIENCIGMTEPITKVLKLICMQSAANNGLRPKLLEYYKREIIQGYGYEYLTALHNLEKAGLLKQQETKVFTTMKKQLKLVVPGEKGSELNPKDVSYVFSGYAPLSVRLVEMLEKPSGFAAFEEATRVFPGPAFQRTQPVPKGMGKKKRPTTDRPQMVLVFFLGGCSYAEISALRFLTQREDATTEYMVGATHLTNGVTLMNTVLAETVNFSPMKIWDNQLDDPAPKQPAGGGASATGGRQPPRGR